MLDSFTIIFFVIRVIKLHKIKKVNKTIPTLTFPLNYIIWIYLFWPCFMLNKV